MEELPRQISRIISGKRLIIDRKLHSHRFIKNAQRRKKFDKKEWFEKRRPEILNDLQEHLYGFFPPENQQPKVSFSVTTTKGGKGNSAYIEKQIRGNIDISSYPEVRDKPIISATLRTPANLTVLVDDNIKQSIQFIQNEGLPTLRVVSEKLKLNSSAATNSSIWMLSNTNCELECIADCVTAEILPGRFKRLSVKGNENTGEKTAINKNKIDC